MDADEIIKTLLAAYGLDAADVIAKLDAALLDDPTQFNGQFGQQLALMTVRDTATYKTRFKANEYRTANGYAAKSEDDIIGMENTYRTVLRANSLPKGFYDKQEDFNKLIGGDTSADELNNRISQGYNAVMQAEPGTKAELKQLYGLSDGDIAAFFIDPTRFNQSDAIKKAQAAQVASEARRQAGFTLDANAAEALATELGGDRGTAMRGFQQIGATQELLGMNIQGETALSQQEQIAGTFGTNQAAAQRIATRKRKRQATFEQGGGFAQTQQGMTGLSTVGQ
tara:strand:+ start:7922 stop:8770 length:849 start_codon:yes stop_codon:yes gene_type:complete